MMNTLDDSFSDLIFSHLVCHWGEGGFDNELKIDNVSIVLVTVTNTC